MQTVSPSHSFSISDSLSPSFPPSLLFFLSFHLPLPSLSYSRSFSPSLSLILILFFHSLSHSNTLTSALDNHLHPGNTGPSFLSLSLHFFFSFFSFYLPTKDTYNGAAKSSFTPSQPKTHWEHHNTCFTSRKLSHQLPAPKTCLAIYSRPHTTVTRT